MHEALLADGLELHQLGYNHTIERLAFVWWQSERTNSDHGPLLQAREACFSFVWGQLLFLAMRRSFIGPEAQHHFVAVLRANLKGSSGRANERHPLRNKKIYTHHTLP